MAEAGDDVNILLLVVRDSYLLPTANGLQIAIWPALTYLVMMNLNIGLADAAFVTVSEKLRWLLLGFKFTQTEDSKKKFSCA